MKTLPQTPNRTIYIFRIAVTIVSFWLVSTNTIFSQNSWIGGTPGAEQEWNNPKNWSENHVPDWSDDIVIIQDVSSQSGFFPIIKKSVHPIGHLRLEGGARLVIEKNGKLEVNGANTYNYGIINIGKIVNYGFVAINNTAYEALENPNNSIINRGEFAMIDSTHRVEYLASH